MGKAELMQEKISLQRQLPQEIKEKINKITFINLIISISLFIYIAIVNLIYKNFSLIVFINSTKIIALIFAIIDIIIFEIAYRKESIMLGVYGIELLFIGLYALSMYYTYIYLNIIFRTIFMTAPIYFSIYYVIKSIIIYSIEKNKYLNNLSDVPEILKDNSENESYIENIDIDAINNDKN